MATIRQNLFSVLIIFLILLNGCSNLFINSKIKPAPLSLPSQPSHPSHSLSLISQSFQDGPAFNKELPIPSDPDREADKEVLSLSPESEHSFDLSFELALKDYLSEYQPNPVDFISPYVLFSFMDHLSSPDEGYFTEIREPAPKKETPKLKPKRKEVKIIFREGEDDGGATKPYYSSNIEEHLLEMFSFPTPPEPEVFSWEDRGEVPFISEFKIKNPPSPATNREQLSYVAPLFPSVLHEKVRDFINYFQNKADSFFSRALARSQAYEEMMKSIFREKNLPEELFYLALIESGFNPFAVSRAQAIGIWQFVSKTAKRFGLRIDKWVDERRDPEKSTYAAAEYLKQLYEMFNCWELAAASYNAGEGKILKAIKKTRSQNFWEIAQHRYLKTETKKYVPMFLAAMVIAKEPGKYGFSNIEYHPPLTYEKIIVPPSTSLAWIAKVSETNLEELKALNPSLKLDKTPPQGDFEIKLPAGKKEVFEKNSATQQNLASRPHNKHHVRPGETLSSIARRYRVNLAQLCKLNGLSPKDKIKPGLVLLIPS